MSYQPPFDGNWMAGHRDWATFEKPPQSVQAAVMFIYAGAVIHAASVIIAIAAARSRIPSILQTSPTPLTPNQQHAIELYAVVSMVIVGIIGVSVWLWMASKNNAGRGWARVLSTVFFACLCIGMVVVIAEPVGFGPKTVPAAEWVVGLVAIVLLWRRESSEYFAVRSQRY